MDKKEEKELEEKIALKNKAIKIGRAIYSMYGCCGSFFCNVKESPFEEDNRPKDRVREKDIQQSTMRIPAESREGVEQLIYEVLKIVTSRRKK